jgi:hypothetical protein
MPLPNVYPLGQRTLSASTNSIASTPLRAVVIAPFTGRLVGLSGVAHGTFTSNCSVAVAIVPAVDAGTAPGSGTAVSGSPMTLTAANSAAGTSASLNPGAFTYVTEGDLVVFTPSGSTGTTIGGTFSATFRKGGA